MIARVPHLVTVETSGEQHEEGRQAMKVHDLAPAPGSHRSKRRVGSKAQGGKGGKTAGRGTKGQKAHGQVKPGFEGGQLQLAQRIPKLRGFANPFRIEYNVVNLGVIEALEETEITPESLKAAGIVHHKGLVKVLGDGELSRAVDVAATRSRALQYRQSRLPVAR